MSKEDEEDLLSAANEKYKRMQKKKQKNSFDIKLIWFLLILFISGWFIMFYYRFTES